MIYLWILLGLVIGFVLGIVAALYIVMKRPYMLLDNMADDAMDSMTADMMGEDGLITQALEEGVEDLEQEEKE